MELIKDCNGVEIPREIKAKDVKISVSVNYEGKYGTEEHHLDEVTLDEFCSIEDLLRYFKEINYNGEEENEL